MALTEEEIVAAAEALLKEGREPTQEAVRAACGNRGSHTTINKYLSRWKAARAVAEVNIAAQLSGPRREQALTLFAAMHSDIRKEYEVELSRRVAEHARREAELEAELDQAADETERLVEERDSAREFIELERDARATLQAELAAVKERNQLLMKDFAIVEARLAEAEKFMSRFAGIAEKFTAGDLVVSANGATEGEPIST